MSKAGPRHRVSIHDIQRIGRDSAIVALTAATTPIARILDAHCDLLLVGDSLGMVLYGMESTLGVTMDMMIAHGRAVMRGSVRACVIVDMPFGSTGESPAQAYRNAVRMMAETGCGGIKLEGGTEMADTIAFLAARGVPVLGHVGLKPQSVHAMGGFRTQGRTESEAAAILADARAVQDAGAFAVVLEGTTVPVAKLVSASLRVPVIGIGASADCGGQILVTEDMLGLFTDFTPRFVRRYAELRTTIDQAAADYAADVRGRRFPGAEHTIA